MLMSFLHLDHKAHFSVYSGSMKSKVQNITFFFFFFFFFFFLLLLFMECRVMHPVGSARQMFICSLQFLNTALLLNNQARFQIILGKELSCHTQL